MRRRQWKKIISMVLALAMVFSMNTSVFAGEMVGNAAKEKSKEAEERLQTEEQSKEAADNSVESENLITEDSKTEETEKAIPKDSEAEAVSDDKAEEADSGDAADEADELSENTAVEEATQGNEENAGHAYSWVESNKWKAYFSYQNLVDTEIKAYCSSEDEDIILISYNNIDNYSVPLLMPVSGDLTEKVIKKIYVSANNADSIGQYYLYVSGNNVSIEDTNLYKDTADKETKLGDDYSFSIQRQTSCIEVDKKTGNYFTQNYDSKYQSGNVIYSVDRPEMIADYENLYLSNTEKYEGVVVEILKYYDYSGTGFNSNSYLQRGCYSYDEDYFCEFSSSDTNVDFSVLIGKLNVYDTDCGYAVLVKYRENGSDPYRYGIVDLGKAITDTNFPGSVDSQITSDKGITFYSYCIKAGVQYRLSSSKKLNDANATTSDWVTAESDGESITIPYPASGKKYYLQARKAGDNTNKKLCLFKRSDYKEGQVDSTYLYAAINDVIIKSDDHKLGNVQISANLYDTPDFDENTVPVIKNVLIDSSDYGYICVDEEGTYLDSDKAYSIGNHSIWIRQNAWISSIDEAIDDYNEKNETYYSFNCWGNYKDPGADFTVEATEAELNGARASVVIDTGDGNIMYGEDDEKSDLIRGRITLSNNGESFDVYKGGSYNIDFGFTTDKATADTIIGGTVSSDTTYNTISNNELKKYPVSNGSIYAVAKITKGDFKRYAYKEFKVVKRDIKIKLKNVISSNRGESLITSGSTSNNNAVVSEIVNGKGGYYAGSLAENDEVLKASSSFTIDVSAIDNTKRGTHEISFADFTLQDNIAVSYNVAEAAAEYKVNGNFEAHFWLEYNAVLNDLGTYSIDDKGKIENWSDPVYSKYGLSSDFTVTWTAKPVEHDRDYSSEYVQTEFKPGSDRLSLINSNYNVYAVIKKPVMDTEGGTNVTITGIAPVTYDRRAHKSTQEKFKNDAARYAKQKNTAYDLYFRLYDENRRYSLVQGTDFTVTYKNNKNASVHYDENGKLVENTTDKSKQPCVIVKGKGKIYGGLTATVYFHILPLDISQSLYINNSQELYNNGFSSSKASYGLPQIYQKQTDNSSISYKYTVYHNIYYYNAKKYKSGWTGYYSGKKLKKGTDYTETLYKVNSAGTGWEKADNANEPGEYLVTLEGMGNYYGSVNGAATIEDPAPDYYQSPQFVVVSPNALILSKQTVKISANTIKLKDLMAKKGSADVTAADFGITVKNKKTGEVIPASAYTLTSPYMSNGKWYIYAKSKLRNDSDLYGDRYLKVSVKNEQLPKKFKIQVKDGDSWKNYSKAMEYNTKNHETRVSCNNTGLVEGRDYGVALYRVYSNCKSYVSEAIDAGKYEYIISGKGIYKNCKPIYLSFTINKISLAKGVQKGYLYFLTGEFKDAKKFNKDTVSVDLNINGTYSNVTVSEANIYQDYSYDHYENVINEDNETDNSYFNYKTSSNKNAGVAGIVVTPGSSNMNYTGKYTLKFTVKPLNVTYIEDAYYGSSTYGSDDENIKYYRLGYYHSPGQIYSTAEDVLKNSSGVYDPKVKLYQYDINGYKYKQLKAGKDYKVTHTNNESGSNTISINTVSGSNNFTFGGEGGSVITYSTFYVYNKKAKSAEIELSYDERYYNGNYDTPNVVSIKKINDEEVNYTSDGKYYYSNFYPEYVIYSNLLVGNGTAAAKLRYPGEGKTYEYGGLVKKNFKIKKQKGRTVIFSK